MPLVVILEEGDVLAGAAAHRRIERSRHRFARALDELNAESLGQTRRHAGARTGIDPDQDLECQSVGDRLGPDRRDRLLKEKAARLSGIRKRLQERRQYDGNRCQSRLPGSRMARITQVSFGTLSSAPWSSNQASYEGLRTH